MKKLIENRPLLWALLAVPAAVVAWRYATDVYTYGQVLHVTGDLAVWFLIAALAATPLRLAWPRAGWTQFLMRRRREFGLAAFGYALFHLLDYLFRKAQLPIILAEGKQPELLTGWIAFLVFILLAATSNDLSVRAMGPGWKRLHRLVYLATALTFAHWLLEAFDPTQPLIYLGIVVAIEAARLVLSARRRRPARAA